MADLYKQLVADKAIYEVSQISTYEGHYSNFDSKIFQYMIPCVQNFKSNSTSLVNYINRTFNNFDFKAHNMCIAGDFCSSYTRNNFKDFDIYCFGNLKDNLLALLECVKPEGVYISTNCITFYASLCMVQVIYKKEFQAKNAYELVSNFDISACEVWFDGKLNFTARSKFTFETNLIFINQTPIHPRNINRITKYSLRYNLCKLEEESINVNRATLYDDGLSFTPYKIDVHNKKMLLEHNYTQLVGYIEFNNVIEQIKTGIIKFSPYYDYMSPHILCPQKDSIFTAEERKLLNYAYVDAIEDSTLYEHVKELYKTVHDKAIDRFPTIIHKVVF
jgi:hypothetical protein